MSDMWDKGDYFVYDSYIGDTPTTFRQILIGKVTKYADQNYHFEPLYFNKEWARHNYYPKQIAAHRWHVESPMHKEVVKVTEEEAQVARLVLL